MTRKRPNIRNDNIGPPADGEPFFAAVYRLSQQNTKDKDVLSLFADVQKRLDDNNITTYTLADLLQNSFEHGRAEIERGTLIPMPIAWIKWSCHQQIRKLCYRQRRECHIEAKAEQDEQTEQTEQTEQANIKRADSKAVEVDASL